MVKVTSQVKADKKLYFRVLGRTLEHFGVQMYKRRSVAIAELVANCWDAGAVRVDISIPSTESYDPTTSKIQIRDDGQGMGFDDIQNRYLVLGLNRRRRDGREVNGRVLMGRKGIGKLAGFGLASLMTVLTWQNKGAFCFHLDRENLKTDDNKSTDIPIDWEPAPVPHDISVTGTIVTLSNLKHKTPLSKDELGMSLARRFSRRIRGEMTILVNEEPLPDPTPPLLKRIPDTGNLTANITEGQAVKYWYGFAEDVIKQKELRGFIIDVNGKVAQAPPFFFDVEATASGQHSTRYVIGEIEADFLDEGVDEESDVVATDRQEIDWEVEKVDGLLEWGQKFARGVLAECRDFRGVHFENWIQKQEDLTGRIKRLDKPSQAQIKGFVRTLGTNLEQSERSYDLVSSLIKAYEFRHFHDVVSELEQVGDNPESLTELLSKLHDWRVLESRAILEVIKGRMSIIDHFERMLATDVPETAPKVGSDNMHDLLAGRPWLLNPEWQILKEEITITTLLREWGDESGEKDRSRLDFLALSSDRILVIIEIKRPDYAADISELNRLVSYRERVSLAHDKEIYMVFLCGREPKISKQEKDNWQAARDREIRLWSEIFTRTKVTYEHYRALLEADVKHPDFQAATEEVIETRSILDGGSVYRGKGKREKGIPQQDVDYSAPPDSDDD